MDNFPAWSTRRPYITEEANDVQICQIYQTRIPNGLCIDCIDARDRKRMEHIRTLGDKLRFATGRQLSRIALATSTGKDPHALKFTYLGETSEHDCGPPTLSPDAGFQFSISHSKNEVMVAVMAGRAVGVDIERVDRNELDSVSATLPSQLGFSVPGESARTSAARRWVRLEAILKAYRTGFLIDPSGLRLSGSEEDCLYGYLDGYGAVRLRDIPTNEGYVAAVAVVGPGPFALSNKTELLLHGTGDVP